MEYEAIKCYGEHKHLVEVSTYENGRIFIKKIPLADIEFKVDGEVYKGKQIIDNLVKIRELEETMKTMATTMDRFIQQVYQWKKEEGEIA